MRDQVLWRKTERIAVLLADRLDIACLLQFFRIHLRYYYISVKKYLLYLVI